MNISRQKLKPCPFCGGEGKLKRSEKDRGVEGMTQYKVICTNCSASVYGEYFNFYIIKPNPEAPQAEMSAIEAWNKRAEPPADQWIPVTYRETTEEERECGIEWDYVLDCPLPDNDTEILVCTKSGSVWTDTFFNDDGCYLDGGYDFTEIAAWMPLPEPYKGE